MINKLRKSPVLTQDYVEKYYRNNDEIWVHLVSNFEEILSRHIKGFSVNIHTSRDMLRVLNTGGPTEGVVKTLDARGSLAYLKIDIWNFPIELFRDASQAEELYYGRLHKFV